MNGILGVFLVTLLVFAVVRIFADLTAMKIIEDEDKIRERKQKMKKTVIAFILGAISTAIMILILNIIPKQTSKIGDSSWFSAFGGSKGQVQDLVNWIFLALTAVIILVFIITTPYKIFAWMWADEDHKKEKWNAIVRNIVIIVIALSITLLATVVMNLIPNPAHI